MFSWCEINTEFHVSVGTSRLSFVSNVRYWIFPSNILFNRAEHSFDSQNASLFSYDIYLCNYWNEIWHMNDFKMGIPLLRGIADKIWYPSYYFPTCSVYAINCSWSVGSECNERNNAVTKHHLSKQIYFPYFRLGLIFH